MPAILVLCLALATHAATPAATECHPDAMVAAAVSRPAGSLRPAAPDTTRRRRVKLVTPADTAMVQLPSGTRAFVAYPSGSGAAPALVVVHEWWGLNSQIREMARKLARQGYVAIVPDLYHGKLADSPDAAHILMRGLDEDAAVADLKAARGWLQQNPRTSGSRTGTMGFCMGGHYAQRLAFADPSLEAVVVFYGTPESRRETVMSLHAALLGHFGAEDQGIDTTRVQAFRDLLNGAGKTHEIYVYPGAGHAFMNDQQPSYHPEAASLAWARTLAFLQKYLKGNS